MIILDRIFFFTIYINFFNLTKMEGVMKLFNLGNAELAFLKHGLMLNAPSMMDFSSAYGASCYVCSSVCQTGCGANCSGTASGGYGCSGH